MKDQDIIDAICAGYAGDKKMAGPVITFLQKVIAYLRSIGVTWPVILSDLGKIITVIMTDVAAGKTWVQIIMDVLAALSIPVPPGGVPAQA
jgi:hypothetical protein